MANVSATIGANTQQAESSISRVLNGLRKLRQESATGAGMRLFASDEITKLSSALNQAIAAAGTLNKLDLSQFDASLRRSAELLQRNAQHYLRAQQALGQPGVAGRFAQQLGAGGNPLNPNFAQLFPGLQGKSLQQQMDYYFKSMLRGTGMSGGYSGGGGRGGITGHGGAAPGGGGEGDGGGSTAILAGVGKLLTPLLAAISIKQLASAGLTAARRNTEAEDTLMRMTRDGGTGAGIGRAGLRMDNQVGSLSEHFEFVGKRYGLSGTEAMQSAQVYAHAAQQNDRQNVAHGLNASAGFARAYGLNINQTAGGLGGLQRTGAIGSTPAAQNEFLLKMAQTLKSTGMTANADEAIDDLAQTVDRYISHDLASPNQGKLDEFAALRAVTYTMPGLSGKHGQNLLSQYDENLRSDQNDARNVMMAVALQRYGIDNPYTVRRIQAEGANFDLSAVPGSRAPQGMTYGQLAAEEAHRIAREAAQGRGTDFDRESMELDIQANLLNLPLPGAAVPYQIYQQRAQDRAKLVDAKAQLARYGLTPESFSNTSGVKDAVDLMGMDNPEDVRAVAKRYADQLGRTGEAGKAREDIDRLLYDANSDPDAIKKRTLEAIAQFGQHGSQATTDRAAQAEQDNGLTALGRVTMNEWNTAVEAGSFALKEFARSAEGAKKILDGFNQTLPPPPGSSFPPGTPYLDEPPFGHQPQPNTDAPPFIPIPRPTVPTRPGTGGGTPTPLSTTTSGTGQPTASNEINTSIGEDLLNLLVPPANASITPTPTTGWNNNPGTIPPDIANTSPTAPTPTAAETAAAVLGDDVDLNSPEWLAELDRLDQQHGFPAGTMRGLAKTESGGKAGTKLGYHYPEGPDGKRRTKNGTISSASGIFGVLDSTGAKPGLGVKPLAGPAHTQTPQEQARFAAEKLAADVKRKGGFEAGLGAYGEGAGYARKVLKNGQVDTGGGQPAGDADLRALAQQRLDQIDQSDPKRRDFSYDNLDPKFAANLKRFVEAGKAAGHGDLMDPISGNRGLAHQRRIKAEAVAAGKGHMAADEGKSAHNFGKAADLGYFNHTDPKALAAGQWAMANAAQFDLQFPMNDPNARTYEPWHVTPLGYDHRQDPLFGVKEAELRDIAAGKSTKTTKAAAAAKEKTPKVPKDTGAKPDTTVASGKGGKTAVPGVDVPKLADVPSSVVTLTPEQQAAQAAKDAEAARQAQAAATPASRLEVSRRAAQQPKAEADSPAANPVQGDAAAVQRLNAGPTPPDGTDARSQGWVPHANTTATGAPKADAAKARELQGLPPVPDGTDARSQGWVPNPPAPGTQEVDADAQKTLSATANKDFGTLAVNVNHYQNGVKQRTESQTLRAGSGGADNTVKGAVNISPEATA